MLSNDSNIGFSEKNNNEIVSEILKNIRPTLPIQNPMPFFVHNNPLQYWEKFPFEEGVELAALTYENTIEEKSRGIWRDLEDFVLPLILSYFDQGLNRWTVPNQKNGLWDWYCNYIDLSLTLKSKAISGLKKELSQFRKETPIEIISSILVKRYPNKKEWNFHLQTLIFHFKGWSGMIQVLETNPSLFPLESYKISFIEWVALIISAENALNEKKGTTKKLWNHSFLASRKDSIKKCLKKIKESELVYYKGIIKSLQEHINGQVQNHYSNLNNINHESAEVQALFCIDDREESLRRALESVNSNYDTYGTVGFFGVDINLKRPGHLIFQSQCPPVITPRIKAQEVSFTKETLLISLIRKSVPYLNESRFTFFEPLFALIIWPLYAIALLLRSFSPKLYHFLREHFRLDHYLDGKNKIEFIEEYSLEQKTNLVSDILGGAGLMQVKSEIVIVLGHAATTTNNPYQKSYGCGACSGQAGFSNAKVFADFANNLVIRNELKKLGFKINESVVFIAACHDTCSDLIYYTPVDLNKDPRKIELFENFKKDMIKALDINKKERWKQFDLPDNVTAIDRASDWSQPRPEFGHSKVALSVFGPRWLTKGLDLKRRSFLVSYEPSLDPDGKNLAYDILNALPVCANINLDYFTSKAFPEALGAGSKLPLNIASGIGLMPGSKGDLKIGLATQMVDQHEALRLLAFVYCDAEKFKSAIAKSPRLQLILKHNWIHLIRIDPQTLNFDVLTEELKNELSLI